VGKVIINTVNCYNAILFSNCVTVSGFYCDRDYRSEWDRLRKEKQVSDEQKVPQVTDDEGKPVSLVTEVPVGQELADIYLKHPANESSEDEEGEQNVPHLTEEGKVPHCLKLSRSNTG
jgi:hypothetical protein